MSVEEWLLFGGLRLDIGRRLKVRFGRAVHLACPAGFIAELPFERWLRRMTDKPVLWLSTAPVDLPGGVMQSVANQSIWQLTGWQ